VLKVGFSAGVKQPYPDGITLINQCRKANKILAVLDKGVRIGQIIKRPLDATGMVQFIDRNLLKTDHRLATVPGLQGWQISADIQQLALLIHNPKIHFKMLWQTFQVPGRQRDCFISQFF